MSSEKYKKNKFSIFFSLYLFPQGWYACAALNEAGSTVKRIFIRVRSTTDGPNIPQPPLTRWGSDQNIIINSITPSSAQSLDITWETTEGIPSTTLTLNYRPSSSKDFQTVQAMIDSKEYRITDLIAHTEYEVFASVPNGLGGSVSNIRKGKCEMFNLFLIYMQLCVPFTT